MKNTKRRGRRPSLAEQHKKKIPKLPLIVGGVAVLALAGAYGLVSAYYNEHFFRGTVINGMDVSGETVAEVESQIASQMQHYSLTVYAREQTEQTISGSAINYQYQSDGAVQKLLEDQKSWQWIGGFFGTRELEADANASYDAKLLAEQIQGLACMKAENQRMPVDAHIEFADNGFVIIPEDEGTALDSIQTQQMLEEAVRFGKTKVDLDENGAYLTTSVKQDDPTLNANLTAYQAYANASITYDIGDERETLDGMTIKNWLTVNADGTIVKNADTFHAQLAAYVQELASRYDTIDTDRVLTSTNGERKVVYAYEYGWQIDQEAEIQKLQQEIAGNIFIEREPVYCMTAHSHGENDLGDSYIEVDLGMQHMYYYMDGALVFDSDFISGKPDGEHNTHPGIFDIHKMESPSVLQGTMKSDGMPEYTTSVEYWIDFDGGIGFHDAPWQTHGFGGSLYEQFGSHGCINLPPEKAAELYSIVRWEDPVVVFN
ncbi:MAG: peptidoglycan binding domain-containing protein [Eubacteriales bacterium]|nr:peptidoglycan binding domain-containing protein [Eubacteriales bacterium]